MCAPAKYSALPCKPGLPTSAVTHGAGYGVIETLSKVAVPSTALLWLLTARPIETLAGIVIVAVPTCVQVVPFAET